MSDIVVIGGGLVGLWTALRIKERDPACDVVVLEMDVCGAGASGRNGGFAMSWWPKLASLVRLLALLLPVLGSVLVTQRIARTVVGKARAWSHGSPARRAVLIAATAAAVAGMVWAWWPSFFQRTTE